VEEQAIHSLVLGRAFNLPAEIILSHFWHFIFSIFY
jgi:hypothetical protein